MTTLIHPDVAYCVDVFDIKVYHGLLNISITLSYPRAAVWDMLVKETAQAKMIELLSKIGCMTADHAEAVLSDTLEYLVSEQLVIKK
jgi:hypothetical protein